MRLPHRLCASVMGAALSLFWLATAAAAQAGRGAAGADTVHGRAIADSIPLAKVAIRVVSLPDSASRTTTTDARGEFSVTFDRAGASYLLSANLIGYRPDTMRIRRPPGAPALGARIDVTVRMSRAVQTLARVQTTARRPRPTIDVMGDVPGPGETMAIVDPNGILSGDMTGDLTSMLGMIPGLTVTPSSDGSSPEISIAGLSSDQNTVAMNGVNTGETVPRDGAFLVVRTASYDPSRGGGGVQSNFVIPTHGISAVKTLQVSLEAPALQWTTPDAARLGQRYTIPIVSGVIATYPQSREGWLQSQSTSFQFQRRTSDLVSLTSANGNSLAAIGVAPDSARRLIETLAQLGIPARVNAVPSARVSTQGSFITRLNLSTSVSDTYQSDPDGRGLTHTPGGGRMGVPDLTVLVGGSWSDDQGMSITPTSLPSRGGDARGYRGTIQATRGAEMGPTVNELSSAVNVSSSHSAPYLDLPSAAVSLQSQLPNGRSAYATLQAAGASAGPSNSDNWSWDAVDKIKWMTLDGTHQFQVSVDGTLDHYAINQTPGVGSYFYNSLSDFAANSPASFSRTLESAGSHGTGLRGALGLSDIQILSRAHALTAQYGLRVEDDHFDAHPIFNPLVDSLVGLRTDHVPSTLTVAPMAGFTWTYAKTPTGTPDTRRQLLGGVRDYRGALSTQSLDSYIRHTGLDAGSEQVQCVGAAVPVPDWSAFVASPSSIPDACADGVGNAPFVTGSPTVSVFAPNYVPLHSVRGDLTWTGVLGPVMTFSVHGMEAVNTNMPGVFDANFNGVSRFALPDENERPVYVQTSSIVPGTGAIAASESRVTSRFAQVNELRSDGKSRNGTVTTALNYQPVYNPRSSSLFGTMSVAYTYSTGRVFANGFTTTDGDPRVHEWNASGASRHTVIVSGLLLVPTWVALRASVNVRSGIAFTPRVAGDVNGDGYTNDRAFIFDPATVSDPAVAAGMRTLLASAPSSARNCLRSQLGTIADANSCAGPRTAQLNLSAGLDAFRLGFKNRGSVSLVLNNALGAADQLLHGASRLHGWGQTTLPDAALLEVRGFDLLARRFIYNVNPQFGSTTLSRGSYRAPFSIALDAKFDLGTSRERAVTRGIMRALIDSGEHDVAKIKQHFMLAGQKGPLDGVISEASTLGLSPEQTQVLRDANSRYTVQRDQAYTDVAKYAAGLKKDYDADALTARWHSAMRSVLFAQGDLGDLLRSTLTPAQIEKAIAIGAIVPGRGYLMYDRPMLERYAQGWLNPI